jgi:Flp pilus assembly protein TadG
MATLTASALTAAYYLQKDKWKDSARRAEYVAECNAAKVMIQNTTADVKDVEVSDKKRTVRIYWNKFTPAAVGTSAPDFCTITGNEADSEKKDYELTAHVTQSFTIDEAQYEDNHLNVSEVFADNMMKAKKTCDEQIAKTCVSKIDSFTSPNLYQVTGIGCPGVVGPPASWATTYIPATNWNPDLMHYLLNVKRYNKLVAPFLLDGKNLNYQAWKAMTERMNANGAGADQKMQAIPLFEDMLNIEEVSPGKTFMIDRGVTAFVNRARWKGKNATSPIWEPEIARLKYSEESDNLPGVTYDVYITTECSGAYTKKNVLIHGMYDLFAGPANLSGGTGIHEFLCGACPTV